MDWSGVDDAYAKLDLQLTCEIIDNWILKFPPPPLLSVNVSCSYCVM